MLGKCFTLTPGGGLFSLLSFFLTSNITLFSYVQVPRESLLFVIPAFGGVVSWEGEGAPYKESDQSITYQVFLYKHKYENAGISNNVIFSNLIKVCCRTVMPVFLT